MKDLRQITVTGLGLLGSSITLRILRSLPGVKAFGYTHRPSTRSKARKLAVATEIVDDIYESVSGADLVILATPIYTFEKILGDVCDGLPANTDNAIKGIDRIIAELLKIKKALKKQDK